MEELENPNEFIDQAEKKIMAVNERGRRTAYQSSTRAAQADLRRRSPSGPSARTRSPGSRRYFTDLDKMTGGLQPGDLVIIAARPSMGKTAFVLNLAQNACIPQARHLGLPAEEHADLPPGAVLQPRDGGDPADRARAVLGGQGRLLKLRSGACSSTTTFGG
jgi:replicative DNA helicase